MDTNLAALLAAFVRLRESEPLDLVQSLQGLPEPGALPSPWNTWTLIGLTRHRERQLWVAEIIRTRLHAALADLADGGAGHPQEIPQGGLVPGMPDWNYFFHGRGCRISHNVDGDAIDVDFWDDSADYFDTFFYKNFLESLHRPEPPEQRLLELHPSAREVIIAVNDLRAAGWLTPLWSSEPDPYRLADKVMAIADDIDSFCRAWTRADRRVWLAALIGDWMAADEAAVGRPELIAITGPRVERCREIRRERLRRALGEQHRGADPLQALADPQAPDVDQILEDALRDPLSGLVWAALDMIGQRDDPRWCARVHELYSRVDPAGRPRLWITSLKFLLRHGHRAAEVIASLAKAGEMVIGEAVLLSLEHAPELALPLIRKGLVANAPAIRTEVAAILALINAPWSTRVLLGALEASDDQEKTAEARLVLLESGDQAAQRAVLAWEVRNRHENEISSYLEIGGRKLGPFYTFSEPSLRNRVWWIAHQMAEFHDRVMKVKDIVPREPPDPRPWWQF